MQVSIVVPASGMNGTTSVAPILGCTPSCCVISINIEAAETAWNAACATDAGGPTNVITVRLWYGSMCRSSMVACGTVAIESVMASIMLIRLPSEKLGMHSTRVLFIA